MATGPQFAATPNVASASVSATADASYTAPTNIATVFTAGASGSKLDQITFQGIGTTVAGTILVFRYDGTTYHLIDAVAVPAVTASTTAVPWRQVRSYANEVLKSGDTIRVTSTVSSQLVKVTAYGGDF